MQFFRPGDLLRGNYDIGKLKLIIQDQYEDLVLKSQKINEL